MNQPRSDAKAGARVPATDTVLLFEPVRPEAEAFAAGVRAALPQLHLITATTTAEALARAADANILLAKAHYVPGLVAAMPRLQWIQALTTGVDPLQGLGLPHSVAVTSLRGIHGPQMAELTLLLMMSLARDFPRLLANQRRHQWDRWGQGVLAGKTVTIVGVGAISEALARRCQPFGLRTIGVTSRTSAAHFDLLVPGKRLAQAAGEADYLVVLAPYSKATHHLIGTEILAAMKSSAFLINVARGNVVDEAALLDALRAGRLRGAALDVFAEEPLPQASPFWDMENVIVTPHIGGMSDIYAEQAMPTLEHNLRAFTERRFDALLNRVQLDSPSGSTT